MNQREEAKQAAKELTKWFGKNLPEVKVGKFIAKRFYVAHPMISDFIIINKNFYTEIIGWHREDLLYTIKLEIAKSAHILLEKAFFDRFEDSVHHAEVEAFLVFKYDYQGLSIEFKVKKNPDGYFLHYMRIL
jgi:hypothetical protein